MNYQTCLTLLNDSTDPQVTLEIASTWTRREINSAITDCKTSQAEDNIIDAADAATRLTILELCTTEFCRMCDKHYDRLDAAIKG